MKRTFDSPGGARWEVSVQPGAVGNRVSVQGLAGELQADVKIRRAPGGDWLIEQDGITRTVQLSVVGDTAWLSATPTRDYSSQTVRFARIEARRGGAGATEATLRSPMTGRVVVVHVEAGTAVEKGQALVVVEAMKMEHALRAPRAGIVARVACVTGQLVEGGAELVTLQDV